MSSAMVPICSGMIAVADRCRVTGSGNAEQNPPIPALMRSAIALIVLSPAPHLLERFHLPRGVGAPAQLAIRLRQLEVRRLCQRAVLLGLDYLGQVLHGGSRVAGEVHGFAQFEQRLRHTGLELVGAY